ncbi:hypothetical protein AXK11_08355 [Cephaloticoccus primus]|uniref:Cytochrome c oxidase assembly protein n=1 Tax=Cephaloticoccus primus TaxID=1548207 RepID=A0A139SIT9_9BACT|nr:cytochrome c oxidase assembly protein [Cephaloticoccus primus]KXU34492.1 hypothetical protein AXK11_08355 [Cephaloticoccus primus]
MIDWSHWHNEPYLIGGLVFLGWLYAITTGPLRARLAPRGEGEPYPRAHAIKFYAALILFYLAVGSPLDQIGERFLFSAHMLQHQLLIYPVPILFLLGLPVWLVDPLLERPLMRRVARLLFNPIVCGLTYTIVISVWHAPILYGWALRDKVVHVIEHLMFFASALLFWWPQLSPSQVVVPRSRYPVQILYHLGVLIGMMPVYAYVTFSKEILYPTYAFAPRIIPSFDPAQDQLLAGTMMQLVSAMVAVAAGGVAFYKWYQKEES